MNPLSRKTSWIIWIILFVSYMYVANVMMPGIQRNVKAVADKPECAKTLDIMIFGINQESAQEALNCMGEEGREIYRSAARVQDSIYPIIYTLFFLFTLFVLGSYLFGRKKFYIYLLLIPLLGMVFDFYENSRIIILIDQFPNLQARSIWEASLASSGKWLLAFTNILILLVFAIMSVIKLIRKK